MDEETGPLTGTKDKTYNVIWFTEHSGASPPAGPPTWWCSSAASRIRGRTWSRPSPHGSTW